jgi:carboxylesterase type B
VLVVALQLNDKMEFTLPGPSARPRFEANAPDTYRYVFTHTGEYPILWMLGAGHGLELTYVFGTLPIGHTIIEKWFSERIRKYWTTFARTGNPNVEGQASWQTAQNDSYLDLDIVASAKQQFHDRQCEFRDHLYEKDAINRTQIGRS